MSVKWSITKILMCSLLAYSSVSYAQETKTIEAHQVFRDTVIITKYDTVWMEKELSLIHI